jgi:thiamine biosynthesis protein ThiS
MTIVLNGETREIAEGATVAALLLEIDLDPDRRGVAVARNGEVIQRSSWADTTLAQGDRLEILHAVQGG